MTTKETTKTQTRDQSKNHTNPTANSVGEHTNQRTQAANPEAIPSNKTHELKQQTHDPGGETHKSKLGLNPRKCMIPSGEGHFPSILSFLFVQNRNSSL